MNASRTIETKESSKTFKILKEESKMKIGRYLTTLTIIIALSCLMLGSLATQASAVSCYYYTTTSPDPRAPIQSLLWDTYYGGFRFTLRATADWIGSHELVMYKKGMIQTGPGAYTGTRTPIYVIGQDHYRYRENVVIGRYNLNGSAVTDQDKSDYVLVMYMADREEWNSSWKYAGFAIDMLKYYGTYNCPL